MKILHVVPSVGKTAGGTSEYVPRVAQAQLMAGAKTVGIVALTVLEESAAAQEAAQTGVRMHRFECWPPYSVLPISFSLEMICMLERTARDYDVMIVHCNWMFPVWWAAHVARKLGKPYVMMPHGSYAPERLKRSAWKKRLVGWIDRHYARHAKEIWVTSETEAESVRKYVPEVKPEVFLIGLDVEKYKKVKVRGAIERSEIAEGLRERRTLLFFSRISPIKGLDMLAEAWGRVCREVKVRGEGERWWNLLIVGPDDRGYRAEIEKVFAAKCPAGSYEFRGPVYGEEKFKLLASADAFVLPTRNENWGICVAEAMASGLPVICTKGAPWSCLRDERSGWWTDVSAKGLGSAILELMSLDDDSRKAMGARGRRWTEENLRWDVIGTWMLEACRRMGAGQ